MSLNTSTGLAADANVCRIAEARVPAGQAAAIFPLLTEPFRRYRAT